MTNDFDDYRVNVTFMSHTTGDGDTVKDSTVQINFDATDATYNELIEKFELFLHAMGYVFDGRHLAMVEGD